MRNRAKQALGLALLLGLAGGALGYREQHRPPLVSQDLIELVELATSGPVLAPETDLGDYNASTFLGEGWGPLLEKSFRTTTGPAEMFFSQTQSVPVTVEVEGRLGLAESPSPQNITIAGQPFVLEKDWKQFQFALSAEKQVEGLNPLAIQVPGNLRAQWRTCHVRPQYGVFHYPDMLAGTDRFCLYYGAAREFPVTLLPSTELRLDDLQLWHSPEAPADQRGTELTVRIQSGKTGLDRTWHLTGLGRQKVRLKVDEPTQVTLTLMARCTSEPKNGQMGLALVRPRLDSWSPPPAVELKPIPEAPPVAKIEKKPNVILYLIDTLRADHLHCYGYANATSPAIDALAADGVRFEDCMAAASWTKPATASILTSLLAHHHRAEDFPDRLVLKKNRKTIAGVLSEAGYDTRGLVANPFVSRGFGFAQGFGQYECHAREIAPKLVDDVTPWLKSSKKPFFLYLHTLDPHMPYYAPANLRPPHFHEGEFSNEDAYALLRDYRKNKNDPGVQQRLHETISLYDGAITGADIGLARLVDVLKKQGLYDNTMIVVVSDHGEELFDHNAWGHLNSLYQELMHVPLVIKFPHQVGAGTVVKPSWQGIDLAPTMLHGAGVAVPGYMEGKAYAPGGFSGDPERPAFISITAGAMADMFGQGKSLRRTRADGVRVGRWKLIRAYSSHVSALPPVAVFDLETDPHEQHNLAYSRPEIRSWLFSLLKNAFSSARGGAPGVGPGVLKNALLSNQYMQ